jgi:hypothetical protein
MDAEARVRFALSEAQPNNLKHEHIDDLGLFLVDSNEK